MEEEEEKVEVKMKEMEEEERKRRIVVDKWLVVAIILVRNDRAQSGRIG